MALARHKLTGLTEDVRQEILDHPTLGEVWELTDNPKPLVDYQVDNTKPVDDEKSFGDPAAEQPTENK